jgi:hypothetical protein
MGMQVPTGVFNIMRMSHEQREKLKQLADGMGKEEDESPHIKSYGLSMKKPGLKALFGENNPLHHEDADELEKFFKLRKS